MAREFIINNFPHIDLAQAIPMPNTGKKWPLCDLKIEGGCQGALVPDDISLSGYVWELEPKKISCETCPFHSDHCDQEHR